ncbi:MAG TPA: hypothetical protein VNW06_09665 [Cytophagaceae bacterium]|jgi:hypothetical protein|nr:hypothetical protein [Cytophagaceae bacterium]
MTKNKQLNQLSEETLKTIQQGVDEFIWKQINSLPSFFSTEEEKEKQFLITNQFFWLNYEVVLEPISDKPDQYNIKIKAKPNLEKVKESLKEKLKTKSVFSPDFGNSLEKAMMENDNE